jgi:hypothetical protein
MTRSLHVQLTRVLGLFSGNLSKNYQQPVLTGAYMIDSILKDVPALCLAPLASIQFR